MTDNHFKIVIPMYNVEKWVETTVKSVKGQNYDNFHCIIIDDISTDNTVNIVSSLIEDDDRFTLIINKEKKYAMQNIYEGTNATNPKPDDIIINLDGDDWLAHRGVLERLNEVYNSGDVLATYGNHTNYPDGEPPFPIFPYPEEVVKNNLYRQFRYLGSHLRSYKYKVFNSIDINDFKDEDGNWIKMTADVAIMIPICELARERAKFIEDVLYVYNNSNPINDYKVDHSLQHGLEQKIRLGKKYERLEV